MFDKVMQKIADLNHQYDQIQEPKRFIIFFLIVAMPLAISIYFSVVAFMALALIFFVLRSIKKND